MSEKLPDENRKDENKKIEKPDKPHHSLEIKETPKKEQAAIASEKKLQLEKQSEKLLETDIMRLQAEFENYKKRSAKELEECFELGKMDFAKSQICFLDEFENALTHLDGEAKKGVQMLLENFKKSLQSHGIREMNCMGERFDPYKYEVVGQEESNAEPETIIRIIKKGYFFKDKILRHAQVIVSTSKKQNNIQKE